MMGHLKGLSSKESQPQVQTTTGRGMLIEQHGVPDEHHVSESSPGSPFGPSHHGTECEEGG